MILSAKGREFIKIIEGLSLKAYKDARGYSIGYGHFGVNPGDVITRDEADRLFDGDVQRFVARVARVTPQTSQQQFDALVSLCYNIGEQAFTDSTLAVRHNAGDFAGAADAFLMWVKSEGRVNPALEKRRARERSIYLTGHTSGGGGEFGGGGASGSWEPEPPRPPSKPPPKSSGAFLAGVGLLFFCPSCGGRCDSVKVEIDDAFRSRETEPAPSR